MNLPKMNFTLQDVLNSLVLIVCLTIAGLLGFFVAWPQYNNYQNSLPTLTEKQTKNDQLDAFVNYLQGLSDFQEKLFANMGLSKQAIPETDEAPFFLDQIIQVAEISNIEIDSLTFGGLSSGSSSLSSPGQVQYDSFSRFQPEDGETIDNSNSTEQVDEFLSEVPIISEAGIEEPSLPTSLPAEEFYVKLGFYGDYAATEKFFANLESARRLTDVREVTIEALKDTNETGTNQTTVIDEYINAQTSKGYSPSGTIYQIDMLVAGFYMKDPEVSIVGPDILSSQKNLDSVIAKIESLVYYEPQSAEEIELNVGRLNPFDTGEETEAIEAGETINEEEESNIISQ